MLSNDIAIGILFENGSDLNEFFVFKPFEKKGLHMQGSAGWIRRDYPHIGRDFLSWELKNTRLDLCGPIQ